MLLGDFSSFYTIFWVPFEASTYETGSVKAGMRLFDLSRINKGKVAQDKMWKYIRIDTAESSKKL